MLLQQITILPYYNNHTVLIGATRDRLGVFTGPDPSVRGDLKCVISVFVKSSQDDG